MIYQYLVGSFETLVYIHKVLVATFDDTCIAFYPFNKRNIRCQLRNGLPIYLPCYE